MTKRHKIRRIVATAYETPWAITREKLDAITDLLDRRSQGHLSDDEIRLRLAPFQSQSRWDDEDDDERPYRLTDAGVAVIPLYGVLFPRANLLTEYSGGTSTQQFADAVHQAGEADDVRRVVIDADSPGGSVLGIEEAAEIVHLVADKKGVIAVATNQMCSAALWICSAASEVVASPSAMVGSIGVYSVHSDYSAADTQAGVRRTVVHAGMDNKTLGNPHETLTQIGRDSLRQEAGDYYAAFLDALNRYRGLDPAALESRLGRRATLRGADAVEAGLVDRVATLSQVVTELEGSLSPSGPRPSALDPRPSTLNPQPSTPNATSPQEEKPMDPRVMQALIKRGLISGGDDKQAAEAALRAWYTAQGKTVPESADQIVADLAENETAKTESGKPKAETPAAPVTAAPAPQQPVADPEEVKLAERNRVLGITERGALLGVDQDRIDLAVKQGTALETFLIEVTKDKAKIERPIGRVETGRAAQDKFGAAAAEVLGLRCGLKPDSKNQGIARDLQYASLVDLCQETFRLGGARRLAGSREDIAQAALGDIEMARNLGADVPIHGPGSFPNILSVLANKILDGMPRYASTTYQRWAVRKPSVPDFKPSTLLRIGALGEMPEHPDGTDFEQAGNAEEYEWIAVDSYGHEWGLTPAMIANDDIGAFAQVIADGQNAYDCTVNRLCCNVLTGNPTLVDGYHLFDATNHGNNIAAGGGGAPSETELSDMRKLFRAMKEVNAKRYLNLHPGFLLCPYSLETTTEKLLTTTLQIFPTGTAGELFRKKVDYDVEPMLEDHSSAYWYLFAVAAAAIVYVYQTGYETVKRRDYYNPKNNCRMYQFEGRVAAAVNNYRGVCRNEGS